MTPREGAPTTTEERRRYPVYVKRPPRTWWLRTGAYRRFAFREATAVFSGAFSVILLLFLFALSRGPQAYEGFLQWLRLPGTVVVAAVIFVATVYHAGTWLRLTSHILVVRLGPSVVPRNVVTAGLGAVWLVVSAVVAYFTVWF